jgi:hypothetical protein
MHCDDPESFQSRLRGALDRVPARRRLIDAEEARAANEA